MGCTAVMSRLVRRRLYDVSLPPDAGSSGLEVEGQVENGSGSQFHAKKCPKSAATTRRAMETGRCTMSEVQWLLVVEENQWLSSVSTDPEHGQRQQADGVAARWRCGRLGTTWWARGRADTSRDGVRLRTTGLVGAANTYSTAAAWDGRVLGIMLILSERSPTHAARSAVLTSGRSL